MAEHPKIVWMASHPTAVWPLTRLRQVTSASTTEGLLPSEETDSALGSRGKAALPGS